MPPPSSPQALSSPDLTGPTSFLDWPTALRAPSRARRVRPFSHVHLEVDLVPEVVREPGLPVFRQMEALLREREVVEAVDVLRVTANLLHAFSSQGFLRVDHWEAIPGGWLPLPEPGHDRRTEPVGHLLRALESDAWQRIASARGFAVRLSGSGTIRADAVLRRVHRERRHSISIDLWGRITRTDVKDIFDALRRRLPVLRASVTSFARGSSGK
jgi:hypothetical protein